MTKNINILSLFSGCGGLDIGFEGNFKCLSKCINIKIHPDWVNSKEDGWVNLKPTGFKTIFANDIRKDAKQAWVSYFSNYKKNANQIYILESIVNLVKQARKGKFNFPKNVDIILGGFPCQDFSIAGKRMGFSSDKNHDGNQRKSNSSTLESRGQLFFWMKEVISIVKPKIFIAENVKGLTTLNDSKKIIENEFASINNNSYLIIPARILHVANYGVPQNRERVIFYGFRKDALTKKAFKELSNLIPGSEYDPYPIPTHNYNIICNLQNELETFTTCQYILKDLLEPNETSDLSQQKFSKAKFNYDHQGNREINLNMIAPTIRSEHHGNIEFRRLSLIHGGKHLIELKNGLLERRLTVRECARIQTFPDNYEFINGKKSIDGGVSASSAYQLIGNAVPCVFAYNIAMRLKENWDKYFKN